MEFTIYTTGSAEFLEFMLNACAMITGSGDAEGLARIGALLGLFLLAFQAVFNNQAITFGKAGLVLALYMMFYGPTATTAIEDTVSSQVRVVDNVPLGPAFVGSVISTVAYGITRTAEQAFSTPSMTDYGLFSSLSTLSKVRDALRNPMALDGFQNYRKADGWDLPRTVNEYLAFCSLNPVALRTDKTLTELYRSPGWAQVMSNQNPSMFVYVYDGSGAGTLKSCAEARSFLNAHLQNVYTDVLEDILQKGFSEEVKTNRMTSGVQVQAATDQAIQSLALSSKSAQDYVLTSLIAPIFNSSRVDALNHWHEKRAAMALREALNQQEIQWAGKGDSFKHYMRPMIAFFEGMLYAMTPFMAFALLLGGPGLSILGKYLVLPLAVGLWMPLLSIVNAFTLWYAGSQIDAVFSGYDPTGPGFAMLQLLDIDKAIGKALGIGGLLAASVPPLALFIVSGSAMVANSVMSQMTAGDKFKSEDVTPRSQESAPVLSTNASFTSDQISAGVSRTGSPQLAETITGDQAASAVLQSAQTASQTATSQYQSSLSAAGQQLASTSTGREAMTQMGESIKASDALKQSSSYNQAVENLRSSGFSESSINLATAASALGGQAGLHGIMASLKTGDGKSLSEMSGTERKTAEKSLSQLSSSVESANTRDLTFATGDAFRNSSLAQSSVSNTDQINQSRSDALQAQKTYSQAATQQDTIRASQGLNLRDAAIKSLSRGGLSRVEAGLELQRMAGATEQGKNLFAEAFNSQSIKDMSSNTDEQRAMAAIRAMNQQGRLGDLVMSQFNPFDFNLAQGDATSLANISDKAGAATAGNAGLQGEFNSRWRGNSDVYAGAHDMNTSAKEAAEEQGAELVGNRYTENSLAPQFAYARNSMDVREAADSEAAQQLATFGKNYDDKGLMIKAASAVQSIQSGGKTLANFLAGNENTQFSSDVSEGQHLGLTDSQAALRAASRAGMPTDSDIYQWASYHTYSEAMVASGGDEDYAKGVHASLTYQATGSDGTSADRPVVETVAAGNRHNPLPKNFKPAAIENAEQPKPASRPRRPSIE
ncbi:TPA: conjugal transfer protein TraG N-terminal domain-containing protein [Pseudomonas aeruginosa]